MDNSWLYSKKKREAFIAQHSKKKLNKWKKNENAENYSHKKQKKVKK